MSIHNHIRQAAQEIAARIQGRLSDIPSDTRDDLYRCNHIDARIEGQTFAAFLNMTTHGNRQSVSLRSPGSRVSGVTIALTRR